MQSSRSNHHEAAGLGRVATAARTAILSLRPASSEVTIAIAVAVAAAIAMSVVVTIAAMRLVRLAVTMRSAALAALAAIDRREDVGDGDAIGPVS